MGPGDQSANANIDFPLIESKTEDKDEDEEDDEDTLWLLLISSSDENGYNKAPKLDPIAIPETHFRIHDLGFVWEEDDCGSSLIAPFVEEDKWRTERRWMEGRSWIEGLDVLKIDEEDISRVLVVVMMIVRNGGWLVGIWGIQRIEELGDKMEEI